MSFSQSPNKEVPRPWECKRWGAVAGFRSPISCVGGQTSSSVFKPSTEFSPGLNRSCTQPQRSHSHSDREQIGCFWLWQPIKLALCFRPAASADLRDSWPQADGSANSFSVDPTGSSNSGRRFSATFCLLGAALQPISITSV